jgi:hypothetical protein
VERVTTSPVIVPTVPVTVTLQVVVWPIDTGVGLQLVTVVEVAAYAGLATIAIMRITPNHRIVFDRREAPMEE